MVEYFPSDVALPLAGGGRGRTRWGSVVSSHLLRNLQSFLCMLILERLLSPHHSESVREESAGTRRGESEVVASRKRIWWMIAGLKKWELKKNLGQVDERREARRDENICTDGRSNYTAQLSLTNGVKKTTRVSHFKAGLKALQRYHCIPYIFRRNSANHCVFSKPRSCKTMHPKLGHGSGGEDAGTHSLYNLYL